MLAVQQTVQPPLHGQIETRGEGLAADVGRATSCRPRIDGGRCVQRRWPSTHAARASCSSGATCGGVRPASTWATIEPWVDTLGDRVEGQHQPVSEDVAGDVDDVVRQHVVPAPQQGQCRGRRRSGRGVPRALTPYSSTRARSRPYRCGCAGRHHQLHHVVGDGVVDEDPVGHRLQLDQLVRRSAPARARGGSTLIRCTMVSSSSSSAWSTSTFSRNRSRCASGSV